MRELIRDVLTVQEAEEIVDGFFDPGSKKHKFSLARHVPAILHVMAEIRAVLPKVDFYGESYFEVTRKPTGHKKHYDGCKLDLSPNHMPWCSHSAVVLLSPPTSFRNGVFKFYNPPESYRDQMYLSLLIYSSGAHNDPQLHSVNPHYVGDRKVLLMFLGEENE